MPPRVVEKSKLRESSAGVEQLEATFDDPEPRTGLNCAREKPVMPSKSCKLLACGSSSTWNTESEMTYLDSRVLDSLYHMVVGPSHQ